MIYVFFYFLTSLSFSGFGDYEKSSSVAEYTSIRSVPVIMRNERIGNNRCRLYLDSGEKVEVACVHQLYNL